MQISVKVSKITHEKAKQIDEFIYEQLNGLFRSYESSFGDSQSVPDVSVKIVEREEAVFDTNQRLSLALRTFKFIETITKDEKIEVFVDDEFVSSFEN